MTRGRQRHSGRRRRPRGAICAQALGVRFTEEEIEQIIRRFLRDEGEPVLKGGVQRFYIGEDLDTTTGSMEAFSETEHEFETDEELLHVAMRARRVEPEQEVIQKMTSDLDDGSGTNGYEEFLEKMTPKHGEQEHCDQTLAPLNGNLTSQASNMDARALYQEMKADCYRDYAEVKPEERAALDGNLISQASNGESQVFHQVKTDFHQDVAEVKPEEEPGSGSNGKSQVFHQKMKTDFHQDVAEFKPEEKPGCFSRGESQVFHQKPGQISDQAVAPLDGNLIRQANNGESQVFHQTMKTDFHFAAMREGVAEPTQEVIQMMTSDVDEGDLLCTIGYEKLLETMQALYATAADTLEACDHAQASIEHALAPFRGKAR